MESAGAILLKDVQGTKFDGGVKSAIKKLMGSPTQSPADLLCGELLMEHDNYNNYKLNRDSNVLLFCNSKDIAPLNHMEFPLLEGIKKPTDRLTAFKTKLEFGSTLEAGSAVCVTVGDNHPVEKYVRAVVHYKGKVGSLPGVNFGVEIMEGFDCDTSIGTMLTGGTFQQKRYFHCPDKRGLFVSLDRIYPIDKMPPQNKINTPKPTQGAKEMVEPAQPTQGGKEMAATSISDGSQHNRLNPSIVEPAKPTQGGKEKATYPRTRATSMSGGSQHNRLPAKPTYTKRGKDDVVIYARARATSMSERNRSIGEACSSSKFHIDQRVAFYNNKGVKHLGTVGWTGRMTRTRKFVIGIKTENHIYESDFEKNEAGMTHLMSAPKRCALFLPEAQVEVEEIQLQGPILSPEELTAQKETFEKAKKSEDHTDAIGVISEQQETHKHEAEKKTDNHSNSEGDKSSVIAQELGSNQISHMQQQASKHDMERHNSSSLHQQLCPDMYRVKIQQFSQRNEQHAEERSDDHGQHKNVPADQSLIQDKEAAIKPNDSGVKRSSQLQSELNRTLQVKEHAIKAKDSEIESMKRRSSQLQSELSSTLQVKEHAIKAKDSEIESMKRRSSQLQSELNSTLQVKEQAIKAKDSEIESMKRRSSQLQSDFNNALQVIKAKNSEIESMKRRSSQLQISAIQVIQAKEAEIESVKRRSSQIQSELNSTLQVKENAIKAEEAEIESVKRRSSQLQSELNNALQVKENAIKAKEAEIESVKRRSFQLQSDVINISTILQDKERIIQSKEDEIQRNSAQIADLQQKVNVGEDTGRFTQLRSKAESRIIPRVLMRSISKQKIGQGAWGEVYSGTFQGERVAIKIAHRDLLHTTTIDMLKREVMIMANIQHPNLVRFVGAVFDDAVEKDRDMPIIVSELMDMNLRDAYKKVNLSPSLVSVFCDVAYALHYLHQHSQPIIHRDVSAPNVLLKSLRSGGYQAKVSDFGSANLVKQATTAGAGAIVYCAPEMFPNEDISVPPQPQTTKVDVFSYGILMLEVIVKEMPTPSTRYTMLQQVKGKWHELIVQCTKPLPCDRPAMADILNKLNKMPH